MDDATIAEIAGKLTAAQKRSILDAADLHSDFGGYPFFMARITDAPWPGGVASFLNLHHDRLTPTGLAVRTYLQEQGNE